MGGLEAAFMRSSPLEAHLLTPSAVVMVDARDSALVFKIRRPRKAPGSNTSSGRKVRAMRGSAERRLLYADGFKVSSNPPVLGARLCVSSTVLKPLLNCKFLVETPLPGEQQPVLRARRGGGQRRGEGGRR
jgi:hypothetical protein